MKSPEKGKTGIGGKGFVEVFLFLEILFSKTKSLLPSLFQKPEHQSVHLEQNRVFKAG
jgi:hypothetical protein